MRQPKTKKTKQNNIMINFDEPPGKTTQEHNPRWSKSADHQYRLLIVGISTLRTTNALLNLVNIQSNIYKISLYAKDLYELKYPLHINKHEDIGLKHFKHSKACIEYSNNMKCVYKSIEEYNLGMAAQLINHPSLEQRIRLKKTMMQKKIKV